MNILSFKSTSYGESTHYEVEGWDKTRGGECMNDIIEFLLDKGKRLPDNMHLDFAGRMFHFRSLEERFYFAQGLERSFDLLYEAYGRND